MQLTKRQRNELINALTKGGVDITQCELQLTDDGGWVLHKPTGSLAKLYDDARGIYRGILIIPDGPEDEIYGSDWKQVVNKIRNWAAEVKYMATMPDLWEGFKRQSEVPADVESVEVDNAPFTSAEQVQILERLKHIKQYLKDTYSLPEQQVVGIEQKLDAIQEASERVGRKDWLMMLYGAVFGMIVNDLVPPSIVQNVLIMTIHGLAHIFGLGGPPPSIPPQA